MTERIASLSDEQAEQALLLLFDLLPVDLWEGGKPTLGEVDGLAEESGDAAAALQRSLESAARQRGDLARTVLEELSGDRTLQPYVDAALPPVANWRDARPEVERQTGQVSRNSP